MNIKLFTEHHLEFLSLKGSCTGSSESTLVKLPHCWKSRVTAHILSAQALPSVNQNGEIEGRRHNPVYDEDEDDRDKLLGNLSISPFSF